MAKNPTFDEVEKLNKAQQEGTITKAEYTKKMKELFKAAKEAADAMEEVTAATISLSAAEGRLNEIFGDSLAAYEANRDVLRQFQEITGDAFESTENLTEATIQKIEAAGLDVDAMIAQAEAAQGYVDEIDKLGPAYKKALKESKPFFEDAATKLGLLSKKGNKFAKTLGSFASYAGEEGGLAGLAKGFTEVINPLNIGISIITKVVEQTIAMAFAVDKAGAAFAKTTGFGREFDELIADTNEDMRKFGVSAEDAQKGITSLRLGLSQFNTLGSNTQTILTQTVVGLEKLGVATDESVKMITDLNKAFGESETQAAEITQRLALLGKTIGMSSSQMIKGFNKALGTLAVYGTKSVEIFKNIAAMARNAGVEVDDLLGIADKFDTFSSSAQTAAKMNAIMGTSFSGVNMMMMDHDERIEHLIKGMQSTGVAFKNLDKFTQQAIAAQVGIKDMAKANKIFGQSLGVYRQSKRDLADQAAKQEEANKRMKAALSVTDELKIIMQEFAINIKPLVPTIKKIAQGFAEFLVGLKDLNPYTILFTGAVMSLGGALYNMIGTAVKIKVFGKIFGKTIATTSKTVANAIKRIGVAGTKAAPGLSALGVSAGTIVAGILAVGAAIGFVILSMAYFVKVMLEGLAGLAALGVGMGEIALAAVGIGAAMYLVATGITALVVALAGLSNPFSAAGAAILIGVVSAIAVAAGAMGYVFDRIGNSAGIVAEMANAIKGIAGMTDDISATFGAIDTGIKTLTTTLDDEGTANVQATIANLALLTTGQAAMVMQENTVGSTFAAIGGAIRDAVTGMASKDDDSGAVTLKLDGEATTNLLDGRIAKAHRET